MKDWFYGLEARERTFVSIGGIVVALIVVWAGIWMPIDRAHEATAQSVDNWQRSLSELRSVSAAMQVAPPSTGPDPDRNLIPMVIVDRTLRELNLTSSVDRQQPVPNGIRVEFDAVAFDQLAIWLGVMSSNYGMEVQAGSLSLASSAGPGRINASLTLERSP